MRLRAIKKQTQFKPCPERSRMGQLQKIFILKLRIFLRILFIKSLSLLSASQRFAADKTMRKPRSLRIKKLTTSRMVANLKFEELNRGLVVS